MDKYDPEYGYKKKGITTYKPKNGYPIVERTNNGLLFPEGPQPGVDLKETKE